MTGEIRQFPDLVVSITRQDLIRYAGAANDYLPQHWDQAMMQGQGFPDVVVHGWLGFAHVVRAATAVLTPDKWDLVKYAVRYRQTIFPGEIRCGGQYLLNAAGQCEAKAWIRTDQGEAVTTATLLFVRSEQAEATP
jgi:hydroxyacyl-ACP dehydratase HTD2-like protein with hotdog domain